MPTLTHRQCWLLLAPLGLAVIGFGTCLVAEAAMMKYAGKPWFWSGTFALVVLNTGVCLVGGAVREEVLHRLGKR